jgi:branched-chain amino acid transport system permease protein
MPMPVQVPFEAAYLLQQLLNALQIGAFYGLLAASYALVYGITRRINFAFGAIATFGAAACFNVVVLVGFLWPVPTAVAILIAGAYATAASALLGTAMERLVIRPVAGAANLSMLVTTIALTITVEEAIRLANGSYERWLPPMMLSAVTVAEAPGFPVRVTASQMIVVPVALAVATALVAFIARHPFGRLWRACAEDPRAAELLGVDVARVRALTFTLAASAAGVAGVLMLVAYGNVNFHTSFMVALKALLAAIVGGIGSVGGALIGGLVLAVIEVGWTTAFGANWRDVAVLLALTALFAVRPQGIVALPGRRDHDA